MKAKPQIKLKQIGERFFPKFYTPDRVLPQVKSKSDLLHTLDWYSHPFIKLRTPDDPVARRRYVEVVRPALRWFCQKYGVPVPQWLEGNGHYDSMDPEVSNEYFGEGPLEVQEFQELEHAQLDAPLNTNEKPAKPKKKEPIPVVVQKPEKKEPKK